MKNLSKQYVRWDDLDAMGHVNNAKYLTYAQEARFAMLGIFNMVIGRAEVDFKAPINEGNIFIDVAIWVDSIGTSSFTLKYELSSNGKILALIKTVQVTVTEDTLSSKPLTQTQREMLNTYIEVE